MRGIPQSSLGKYLVSGGGSAVRGIAGLGNTVIGYDEFGAPYTDDGLPPTDGSGSVATGAPQVVVAPTPVATSDITQWLSAANQLISSYTGAQVQLSQASAAAQLAQINAQRAAQGLAPLVPGQAVPLSPMAKAGIGLVAGGLLLSAFLGKKRK